MRYQQLGNSGIEASVIGFGCWAIGGWMWGGSDEDLAIRAIHQALDSGINLFDTAPVYGFGVSEKVLGKAIKDRREKVVLATKCGLNWNKQKGEPFFNSNESSISDNGEIKVFKNLSPKDIREELEQSLQRLETDYIDLYQSHWQDSTVPIEESMHELMKLKKEGKIRSIGCSNVTVEQLQAYQNAGKLDTVQELYSLLDRKKEQDILPVVDQNKLSFLAYSPLGQGLLTGKIDEDRKFSPGDLRLQNGRFSPENRKKMQKAKKELLPLASSYGIDFGQLCLAWIVSQNENRHTLVGARSPEQAAENARAGSVKLKSEELKVIEEVISELGIK